MRNNAGSLTSRGTRQLLQESNILLPAFPTGVLATRRKILTSVCRTIFSPAAEKNSFVYVLRLRKPGGIYDESSSRRASARRERIVCLTLTGIFISRNPPRFTVRKKRKKKKKTMVATKRIPYLLVHFFRVRARCDEGTISLRCTYDRQEGRKREMYTTPNRAVRDLIRAR